MKHYKLPKKDLARLTGREKIMSDRGEFEIKQTGHLFELESVNHSFQPAHLVDVERSEIISFSRQSRSRLIREVCTYGALVPLFVTLTYGDHYPTPFESKEHLKLFWRKISRRYKEMNLWAVWKLEFQKRGAPHYHLLIYSEDCEVKLPAQELNSLWAKTCIGFSVEKNSVDVEKLRSHRGGVWYATKYLCKEESYEPPEASDGSVESQAPGRFWGVLSRKNRPANSTTHRLSPSQYRLLLSEMIQRLAHKLVSHDLMDKGCPGHEVDFYIDSHPELVEERCKEIFHTGSVPVHLMSDESEVINRIKMMTEYDHPVLQGFKDKADAIFRDL